MSAYVVDVNVPIVANLQSPQADAKCVLACISALQVVVSNGELLLDDKSRIIDEYRRNLSPKGQPGVGDAFMKWEWDNQAVSGKCELVKITPIGPKPTDFAEYPNVPELSGFDKDDRKYVAVALASNKQPEILNAVDTDWWDFRQALRSNGVKVKFLCAQHM